MCQTKAKGGRRCAAHQPGTIAVATYITSATGLSREQADAVLRTVRSEHPDTDVCDRDEAQAALTAFARRVEQDDTLTAAARARIEGHLDRAFGDLVHGQCPTRATVAAWESGLARAQAADAALSDIARDAAQTLGQTPAQVRARLDRWRDAPESAFEDVAAQNPDFRYETLSAGQPQDPSTVRALRKLGWEASLCQKHPVFVYGTLREGQANRGRFGDAITTSCTGSVDGVAVYGPDRPFPFAKAGDAGARAVGDVVWVSPGEAGQWARQSLDRLEGFDSDHPSQSLYGRQERTVRFADPDTGEERSVTAWVYLASERSCEYFGEDEVIPDGDWVTARALSRAGGW